MPHVDDFQRDFTAKARVDKSSSNVNHNAHTTPRALAADLGAEHHWDVERFDGASQDELTGLDNNRVAPVFDMAFAPRFVAQLARLIFEN